MDFKAISSIVSKAAPLLGGALGSPIGSLVIALIAQAFGADTKSPQDILSKLQSDANTEVKLKQIEADHEISLRQFDSTDFAKAMDDVADARNKDEKDELFGRHTYMLPVLGISSIVLFSLVIFIVLFTPMDSTDHDVLYMMIGQLVSLVLMVYGFYFGNSLKNSSHKL
jgi:hypothetical protein